MNGRAGKTARRLKHYRNHLKSLADATDPTKGSMQRDLYFGSKCNKPDSHRRPHRGGTVCH